eukprot:gene6201-10207_t
MYSVGAVVYNPQTQTFIPTFGIEHVYCIILVSLTFILNMYLLQKVARARKKYNVKAPQMYEEATEKDGCDTPFNRIQRGHQNFLEAFPFFIILFTLASVFYPLYALGGGVVFIISRIVYSIGYETAASKREYGAAPSFFSLFFLFGAVIYACYGMILTYKINGSS